MATPHGVGIDLGTTRTTAAVHVDGRVEVVRLGTRRPEIPSLVFVQPGGGLETRRGPARHRGVERAAAQVVHGDDLARPDPLLRGVPHRG